MRDKRDRAGRQRVGLDVAHRAQAMVHVREAHAASAAELHPRRRGDRGQALPQREPRLGRLGGPLVCVAEDDGGPAAGPRCQRQLLLQRGIGHAEQRQVNRLGQVSQRRVASPAADGGVARVHRVDDGPRR